jgi:hypothetical protein
MNLVKNVFLMLVRVLNTFILLSLLLFRTMVFLLGYFGYSTILGTPLVSIICGEIFIFASIVFMVIFLYDYQKIQAGQSCARGQWKMNLVKDFFLMLERVLNAFLFPSLLLFGTMIFLFGCFRYSTIFGSALVSIICGGMLIFVSMLVIITFLYDYQKIIYLRSTGERLNYEETN